MGDENLGMVLDQSVSYFLLYLFLQEKCLKSDFNLNSQGGLPVQVWYLLNRGSGLKFSRWTKWTNTKRTPILQPASYTRLCCNGVLHSFYCNFSNWMGINTSFTSFDYSKLDLQRKRANKIKFIPIWFHRNGLTDTLASGNVQTSFDTIELFGL